jgi:hypothetical protein
MTYASEIDSKVLSELQALNGNLLKYEDNISRRYSNLLSRIEENQNLDSSQKEFLALRYKRDGSVWNAGEKAENVKSFLSKFNLKTMKDFDLVKNELTNEQKESFLIKFNPKSSKASEDAEDKKTIATYYSQWQACLQEAYRIFPDNVKKSMEKVLIDEPSNEKILQALRFLVYPNHLHNMSTQATVDHFQRKIQEERIIQRRCPSKELNPVARNPKRPHSSAVSGLNISRQDLSQNSAFTTPSSGANDGRNDSRQESRSFNPLNVANTHSTSSLLSTPTNASLKTEPKRKSPRKEENTFIGNPEPTRPIPAYPSSSVNRIPELLAWHRGRSNSNLNPSQNSAFTIPPSGTNDARNDSQQESRSFNPLNVANTPSTSRLLCAPEEEADLEAHLEYSKFRKMRKLQEQYSQK